MQPFPIVSNYRNINFNSNQQSILKSIDDYELKAKFQQSFFGDTGFQRKFDRHNLDEIRRIGQQQLNELKRLPFWLDNVTLEEHEEIRRIVHENTGKDLCCFNHAVGLPKKRFGEDDIRSLPIFDFEIKMAHAYEDYNRIFIRKSRGLGATTFSNRYLAWKCLRIGHKFNGYRIMYLAGVGGQAFAEEMILRLRNIFMVNYPEFIMSYYNTNDRQVINGIMFEAFPSQSINALRGYENVLYLLIDEADYFRKKEEKELLGAILSYEEKSKGKVILISTPYLPDGLFYNIEFNASSDYEGWEKLLFDYNDGKGKIYDQNFINREQHKTYFRREYMGLYEGGIGNIFPIAWIDAAAELADMFPIIEPVNRNYVHYIGIDPAFRTSKFAIIVLRHNKYARYPPSKIPDNYYDRIKVPVTSDYNISWNYDMIEVLEAYQYTQPDVLEMVNKCMDLYRKYGETNVYFIIDSSAIPFIQSLKIQLGENPHYERVDREYWRPSRNFKAVPIHYSLENKKKMLSNLYDLLSLRMLSISKDFRTVIASLHSANGREFVLNKEESAENDILDALAQAVYFMSDRTQQKRIYY